MGLQGLLQGRLYIFYLSMESTKHSNRPTSSEYWNAIRLPTPILGKLDLKVLFLLQLKCHLEQNTFWNVLLESEVNLWKSVEMVENNTKTRKYVLPYLCPKSGDRTLQYLGDDLAWRDTDPRSTDMNPIWL
jgi:hypothetical protein